MSEAEARSPGRSAAESTTVPPTELTPCELEQSIARVSALYHAELRKLDRILDLPALPTPRAAAVAALPSNSQPSPIHERPAAGLVPSVRATPRPARRRVVLIIAASSLTLCLVTVISLSRLTRAPTGTLPVATAPNSATVAPTNAAFGALPGPATALSGATPTAQATPAPTLIAVPITASPVLGTSSAATVPSLPTTAPAMMRTPTTIGTLRQRAITAEKTLRSGQLVATIDYGNGTRATSTMRFDFGGAGKPTAMQLTITYAGVTGNRSSEFIVIGERYWQRAADGTWMPTPPLEGVRGQVSGFLPRLGAVGPDATSATFRWHDAIHDAEVTLDVDPTTGIPQQFSRVSATTRTTLTVVFIDWDTPQVIALPQAP